jgi:hypothetical protein
MPNHRIPRTVVMVGCHLCGEYAKPLRKCSEGYICAACAQRIEEQKGKRSGVQFGHRERRAEC